MVRYVGCRHKESIDFCKRVKINHRRVCELSETCKLISIYNALPIRVKQPRHSAQKLAPWAQHPSAHPSWPKAYLKDLKERTENNRNKHM